MKLTVKDPSAFFERRISDLVDALDHAREFTRCFPNLRQSKPSTHTSIIPWLYPQSPPEMQLQYGWTICCNARASSNQHQRSILLCKFLNLYPRMSLS
jgi:hypothetical protein